MAQFPSPRAIAHFPQTGFSLILRDMYRICRRDWLKVGFWLAASCWLREIPPAHGQFGGMVSGNRFELTETVQLDQADNAVMMQWDRAKVLLNDRQWDEAVEILCQLAESSEGKLIGVTSRRFIGLREWCQLQFAALPAEALKRYRARVDPAARRWYEQGIADRNPALLRNVVDQAFASTYGDKALYALGEIDLERSDYTAARWCWERILPSASSKANAWPAYPDTTLDLAAVRARLVLVSILEGPQKQQPGHVRPVNMEEAAKGSGVGDNARAVAEWTEFARLHPDARGRLGEREGKYVDLLKTLLDESRAWPPTSADADWLTFAGNPARDKVGSPLADLGTVAWRVGLVATTNTDRAALPKTIGENPIHPLGFYPLHRGNRLFVSDSRRILALRLDTGRPAWGEATIYQSQLEGASVPPTPTDVLGIPRYTLTIFQDKLFARMGSAITGFPQGSPPSAVRPGSLVCLDLTAEGRLLWKIDPENGWAFEGAPVVHAGSVYVAMRREDIRPQAYVACFDAGSGRPRWRRFVCSAETPARGAFFEITQNLLTLAGRQLYYNTNLGAVAALNVEDGRVAWVALYPRTRRGDLSKMAPHWRRSLTPCVFDRGILYVAPADSPRIFAFDAACGQMLWQTGTETEDVYDLLGTAGDWLVASGRRLFWISLKDEDRGRVKHVWPDSAERPGYGRGLLAGDVVLWPTREKLFVFDQQTAEPRKTIDLSLLGITGGNLITADGRLLIATDSELVAIGPSANKTNDEKSPLTVSERPNTEY